MVEDNLPLARAEALVLGIKFYAPGTLCVNGHVSPRRTISGTCIACEQSKAVRAKKSQAASDWYKRQDAEKKQQINSRLKDWQKAWRLANPEEAKEQDRLKRLKLDAQKRAETMRKWREVNRESLRDYDNAYKTQWRLDNPDLAKMKGRIARQRRTVLERGAEGSYKAEDVLRLMVSQQGICATPDCQEDISKAFEVDHIVPLIKGGSNWPSNIQLLCCSCNSRKHVMTMDDFVKRRKSKA